MTRAARDLAEDDRWKALLTGIFGSSPYLTDSLVNNLATVADYAAVGPEAALARSLAALRQHGEDDIGAVERALRAAKRQIALIVALADLDGTWSLETVTRTLSDFAALAVDIAAAAHARTLTRTGAVALPEGAGGLAGSGIIVLGM
ncbi:MAG: glutamine-synthetase adenylyltransferase, partial [Rhodospirillaceae bacterium]|nr:glutamine-synthetase adenylyltransferase [Rhodospirillaceae bacterium]